jgi:hypothetical protein
VAILPSGTKRLQAARQRQTLETYSTPWLYTLFGLFSVEDYEASQRSFQLASLLGYALAIVLFARLLQLGVLPTVLWMAALLGVFNPFVDDVLAGNVNRLQLLALAVVLYLGTRGRFRGRHVLAGALLGATLAFKPNLGSAVLVLLAGWAIGGEVGRALRTLAGVVGGALAAVLASVAYFGSFGPWPTWSRQLPALMSPGSPTAGSADEGNYSLARWLHDTAGLSVGVPLALALLAASITGLVVSRRRRAPAEEQAEIPREADPARDLVLLGTGAAISLLSSELAWQHYFVVLVPLAMALLRPVEGNGSGRTVPSWIAAAALVGLAMVSLQNVGRLFEFRSPSTAAAVVAGGRWLLFVAGRADLARARQDLAA